MKFQQALKSLRKNNIKQIGTAGYITLENGCDVVQVYANGKKRTIGTLYDFEEAEYKIIEEPSPTTGKVPK